MDNLKKKLSKLPRERRHLIQRGVLVVKKAAMKNIEKNEVQQFLKQKNMSDQDIEIAFAIAQVCKFLSCLQF